MNKFFSVVLSSFIISAFAPVGFAANCNQPNSPNCTPAQYYDSAIANNIAAKKKQLQQSQQNIPQLPPLQFPTQYQTYAPANQGHQDYTSSSPAVTDSTSQNNNNGFSTSDIKADLAPAKSQGSQQAPVDVTNSGKQGPVKYKYNFQ